MVVCFSSGKADKVLLCHSSFLSFFKSSSDLVVWINDVFCDLNVSFDSHFSCTLQVNTVATVLLGLVVLFTILAVKSLLFTNGKGSVSEMNRACSYFELQSRVVSMGFAEFKAKTKSSLLISYSTLSQIENCYQHLRSILQTLPCCFSRLTAVLFFFNFNITCCRRLVSLGLQPAACHVIGR